MASGVALGSWLAEIVGGVMTNIMAVRWWREDRMLKANLPEYSAAAEYGAAVFITKPVDFDFLKEQLRQLPASAG